MRKSAYRYFYLDESKCPVECTSREYKGKRTILKSKSDKDLVWTFFNGVVDPEANTKLFKTCVYNSLNHTIFVNYYDSYDDAVKGHKLIHRGRPWETKK